MDTVPLRVRKVTPKERCKECERAENRRSFVLRCMLGGNTNCQNINAEEIVANAKILERYLKGEKIVKD